MIFIVKIACINDMAFHPGGNYWNYISVPYL